MKQALWKYSNWLYDCVLGNKSAIKVDTKELLPILFYLVTIGIGQIFYHDLNQFELYKDTLYAPFWLYQLILVSIGLFAFFALRKFDLFEEQIVMNAKCVLRKKDCYEIIKFLSRKKLSVPFAAALSFVLSSLFVSYTNLSLSKYRFLPQYAFFLVFTIAMSVSMAYIVLVFSVLAMRKVYLCDFRYYVLYYPISTNIFRSYNKLISFGLISFWTVSIPVLSLTLVVTQRNTLITGIAVLILLGFVIFTIYPFYFTRAKVNELKLLSMKKLLNSPDTWSRKVQKVKVLQESPTQTTGNFQSLFWSTALAGCSFAIQQLISRFI